MRQQDHRRVVRHFGKRAGEIIDADAAALPQAARNHHVSQLIAEPREPERFAVLAQLHDLILVNRNADILERALGKRHDTATGLQKRAIVPELVIAENGVDAERRPQLRERARPVLRGHRLAPQAWTANVVAQQHDQIGIERIGLFDDRVNAIDTHIRFAGVQVGKRRDPERETVPPSFRSEVVSGDPEPQRLSECVAGAGRTGQPERCSETQKLPT